MSKNSYFKKLLSCLLSLILFALPLHYTVFGEESVAPPRVNKHVPAPIQIVHTQSSNQISSSDFPSKFDLRESGKLTEIRDQGLQGACWAFATYGAIESKLLPNESWDFSEENLAMSHGLDWTIDEGGNQFISIAYLSRWSGPVLEADDPYGDGITPSNLETKKHLQEALFITKDEIKEALMTHGAVHTSIYAGDTVEDDALYYNPDTFAFYYNEDASVNHDIAIVGWDDTFPAENFVQTPPGDGAYICRNSWGKDWGEQGYYYVSYYDTKLANEVDGSTIYTLVDNVDNYEHIYQYDPLGLTWEVGFGSETAWFANVFNKESNKKEDLSAVSFYTNGNNAAYEIWTSSDFEKNDFSNMTKVTEGIISSPGYHTITLEEPVSIEKNTFAVAVKLTTPGHNTPIAVEKNVANYASGATANKGESFVSANGNSWKDITTNPGHENTNVCLKAFTKEVQPSLDFSHAFQWENKENTPTNKIWKIKFNQGILKNTITPEHIKVYNANTASQIEVQLNYDEANNAIEVMPLEPYLPNNEYYLYIDNNLKSLKGDTLKEPIAMKFITENK